MLMLARIWFKNYNPVSMGLDIARELVGALRDPKTLTDLHVTAERSNTGWSVNHALICAVTGAILDPIDTHYASIGAGVHEVLVEVVGRPDTQPFVISQRHNVAGLLVGSTKNKLGIALDLLLSFHQVEPEFYEVTGEVVDAHVPTPSAHRAAMIGAALSYSLQLSATER